MFVYTEGVTYVHLKVVNTEGVTFRSVHKPNWDNHWTNERGVTTADHTSVGGLRCSQPSEIGTSTGTAAANQRFFWKIGYRSWSLCVDVGLSLSIPVYLGLSPAILVCRCPCGSLLCRSLSISFPLSISGHLGLYVCWAQSISLSVCPLLYIKNGSLLHWHTWLDLDSESLFQALPHSSSLKRSSTGRKAKPSETPFSLTLPLSEQDKYSVIGF